MATSCTNSDHPYYKELSKMDTKKVKDFFLEDSERMGFVSLGEMLDFASFGGMNYVVWPGVDINGMTGFVQSWMDAQDKERDYLWNRSGGEINHKLPLIRGEHCPKKGHKETIKDIGGRVRCAEFSVKRRGRTDICYDIISESEDVYLPLESILFRLNVGARFIDSEENPAIFPFSGYDVADYAKAWWNQDGEKKLFLPANKTETYRVHKDFRPHSSDD